MGDRPVSDMSAATVGADVPVIAFIKTNGPRPKRQKAVSHAVRTTTTSPKLNRHSGDKQRQQTGHNSNHQAFLIS
jgi:hypothetical protein